MMKNFTCIVLCLWVAMACSYAQVNAPNYQNIIRSGARAELAPFFHGVASGDPLATQVILWTRVTTDSSTAQVRWRIATDTAISQIVDSGIVQTNAIRDFCVKVDVQNLQPNRYYYYEFDYLGQRSVRGRTRTLPVGDVDNIRLAAVSCANYEAGFFNVYNALAKRNDIDYLLHLGDYIYEYGSGAVSNLRPVEPQNEIINLADYRLRYSYYKLDYNLIMLHQQYPFICIWDDHETANDAWRGGAQNHTQGTEGLWEDRKSYAAQAYYEWLPIRRQDMVDTQRIYRNFRMGDLFQLSMLDTRIQGRDQQNGIDPNPNRTILGRPQFDWFCNNMDTSTALWQIVGQQVSMTKMFAPISINPPVGALYRGDGWDGYGAERNRLFDTILQKNINNVVVLTGDLHSAWASNLPTDFYQPSTGAGSAGVEFITNSVSSPNHNTPASTMDMLAVNPHIYFIQTLGHGYTLLDINKQRSHCHFYTVSNTNTETYTDNFTSSYYVNSGQRHLITSNQEVRANPWLYPAPAPLAVRNQPVNSVLYNPNRLETVLMGVYPNPFNTAISLQYSLSKITKVQVEVYNLAGQLLRVENLGEQATGWHTAQVNVSDLLSGTYLLKINMGDKIQTRLIRKE